LTEDIEKKFKIDNPQIEIKEIAVPELNAQAQANRLKELLERGFSWRNIAYRAVKEIAEKKAQGVELILSGKLAGKGGRKKKTRIAYGYMKKTGDMVRLVDYGQANAYPKAGAIGIKVRIIAPDTFFPDKIDFKELFRERALKAEEALEAGKKALPAEKKEEAVAKAVEQAEEELAKKEEKHEKKEPEKKEHKEKAKKEKAEEKEAKHEKKEHEKKEPKEKEHEKKEPEKKEHKEKEHEKKEPAQKAEKKVKEEKEVKGDKAAEEKKEEAVAKAVEQAEEELAKKEENADV
jgi:small subunit ribosomal protein S3